MTNRFAAPYSWLTVFGPSAFLVTVLIIAGSVFFSCPAPAAEPAADGAKSADAILEAYIEATGGKSAYDRIRNRVVDVSLEIDGTGITMNGTVTSARPNLSHTLFESDMIGRVEKGTDGKTVWANSTMTGPQIVEGAEREFALREGALDKFVHWEKLYASAEATGIEECDDRPCHKLQLTPETGQPQTLYFDAETSLLVRLDMTVDTAMGSAPVETVLGDYREVDGILLPHTVKVKAAGQVRTITTTSIRHNVELPAGLFGPPAEVLALVEPADE